MWDGIRLLTVFIVVSNVDLTRQKPGRSLGLCSLSPIRAGQPLLTPHLIALMG